MIHHFALRCIDCWRRPGEGLASLSFFENDRENEEETGQNFPIKSISQLAISGFSLFSVYERKREERKVEWSS